MKHKYITKQMLLVFRAKPLKTKKDIHTQLDETIAERKRVLPAWEKFFLLGEPVIKEESPVVKKDIHVQLAETIAEYKRIRKQSERLFLTPVNNGFLMQEKEAA